MGPDGFVNKAGKSRSREYKKEKTDLFPHHSVIVHTEPAVISGFLSTCETPGGVIAVHRQVYSTA
jgi:hypothetical protein